jgi:hypothetical protein
MVPAMEKSGPSLPAWHWMQAFPGFISSDSSFPPTQATLLVQMGPQPVPDAYPPVTQELSVARSAAETRAAGAGGMGAASFCILASASSAFVLDGSVCDAAFRMATLVSEGIPSITTAP